MAALNSCLNNSNKESTKIMDNNKPRNGWLDKEVVQAIRDTVKEEKNSKKDIRQEFGISPSTFSRIVNNKIYTDLPRKNNEKPLITLQGYLQGLEERLAIMYSQQSKTLTEGLNKVAIKLEQLEDQLDTLEKGQKKLGKSLFDQN